MTNFFRKFFNILQRRQSSVLTAAVMIMISYGMSMLLGVVRERLLVAYFFDCCRSELDVYYAAFRLPDTLFQLLVTGSLSAAFIPIFSELLEKSEHRANKIGSTVLNGLVTSFVLLGVPVFIFAPQLSALITGSFSGEQINLMAQLTRIMLISQLFFLFSSFMTGVIQSHNRFLIPALSPVIYNLSIIFGVVFLTTSFGIYAPVFGVVIGSILHAGIQIPLIIKLGFRYVRNLNFRQPEVKEILRLMIPRTLSSGISQFEAIVAVWFATSLVSGSLVIFSLAQMLMYLPIRLIGVPISQAVFPLLSRESGRDKNRFTQMTVENLLQILYLVLPITAILLILRIPVVRLAYGASNFPWQATLLTGRTLALFALAIPAQAMVQLLVRCFYALKNTRIPLAVGILSMLVFLLTNGVLIFKYGWDVRGLAVAVSLSSFLELILLLIFLNRSIDLFNEKFFLPVGKLLFAGGLTAGFLWIPLRFLDQLVFDTTRVLPLIGLTMTAASIGMAMYFSLCHWLGITQQDHLWRLMYRLPAMRKSVDKVRTLTALATGMANGRS